MTLTREDYEVLSRPFEAHEHEFREGSKGAMLCYITEEAITPRLVEVDPAFALTEPIIITDKPENISVKIGITLKGVTRWGIGTSELKTFTCEPTKSAVTDAFKRAARMFGVGLYLQGLKAAKWVNDENSLAKWLAGATQSTPSQGKPSQPSNVRNLPPQQNQSTSSGNNDNLQYGKSTLQVFTKETAAKDKRYMTVSGVSIWSRKPFEALGFNEQMLEQLGNIGEHILPHAVTPVFVIDKNNYKKLVQLRRDDTGEIVDADGNPIDQPQAANQ